MQKFQIFWKKFENLGIIVSKILEKILPKNPQIFFQISAKIFEQEVYVTEQVWCTISTIQQKLGMVNFLQPEIVFGSWRIFAKEFFWSQKFRDFWLFSKKFLCCEALFLKQKKTPSSFSMSCRLSILSALAELDKKISLDEVFFFPNVLSGMGFENLVTKRESFGD